MAAPVNLRPGTQPPGALSRRLVGVGTVLVAALSVPTFLPSGRAWLHGVDRNWLGERLMDTAARVRTREDWSTAVPLRRGQDYAWLQSAGRPVRIAHALGEAGRPTANTRDAARRAHARGFRVLEVDLVLDGAGLQCRHDAVPPPDAVSDGCTFPRLLAALPSNAWLVLDIKSQDQFERVGRQVIASLPQPEDARRIVFQLYRPEQFALFNRWQADVPLAGPILSTYLAHRRIDHVAGHAGRLGIQALTLPSSRLPALTVRPAGTVLLVHPVHDCAAWGEALSRADGVYMLSSLQCGQSAVRGAP